MSEQEKITLLILGGLGAIVIGVELMSRRLDDEQASWLSLCEDRSREINRLRDELARLNGQAPAETPTVPA